MSIKVNSTANTDYAFDRDLNALSNDEYMGVRKVAFQYLDVMSFDRHSYKEGEIAGFRGLSERDEGDSIVYETFEQGNTKEIFFSEYALASQYTRILEEDDEQGVIKSIAKKMGNAAGYTVEYLGADILNTGFVTTYRTGIDGVALFSDSHPYINYAGTQDNNGGAALSYSSMQTAITHFKNLKDKRGIPMEMLQPTVLIIPPALEWTAKELLLNPYRPVLELGTAGSGDTDNNNQKNLLQSDGAITYICSPYLTSSTAWFLLDMSQKPLKWWWRRKYTFESNYTDFDTDDRKLKASFRATCDFINWRGAYGSTP